MKKYKYLVLAFACFAYISCEDLDREFVTTQSQTQIEQSFGLVGQLLTGIYTELPDGMQYIGGDAMMASASDESEFTLETNSVQNFNSGSWNSISNPDLVWNRYYRGIRRANQFLVSTDKINLDNKRLNPDVSVQISYQNDLATIKRWNFEARFLRAYFYFELVKRYGGVPLLLNALETDDDFSTIKRSSLAECIDFIVSECDAAALGLPLNTATASFVNAQDLGRATKLSALALKSRVLLYAASDLFNSPSWAAGYTNPELISLTGDRTARWKAASDAAKAVIDATGLPTLGSYKSLFNTNNNAEIILARANSTSNAFAKNNSPIGFQGGESGNTPSQNLVDDYEVRISTTATAKFDWNNPLHVANIYNYGTPITTAPSRDPRLGFTVVNNNSTFGTPNRAVETYIGGKDAKPIINATKTGYYLRKYQVEAINLTINQTAVHSWILFRYPEIYLNYAEALNEWSPGSVDIKNYIDRIRTRSGVGMPAWPTAGYSQTEARERIRNERRVELAFEDHRFWDVRRWMTAPQVLGTPLFGVKAVKNSNGTFTYSREKVEDRVFNPKMYFYPIPQNDLNIAKGLVQNPLW